MQHNIALAKSILLLLAFVRVCVRGAQRKAVGAVRSIQFNVRDGSEWLWLGLQGGRGEG